MIETLRDGAAFDIALLVAAMKAEVAEVRIRHTVQARHDREMLALRRIHQNEGEPARAEIFERVAQLRFSYPVAISQFDHEPMWSQQRTQRIEFAQLVFFWIE